MEWQAARYQAAVITSLFPLSSLPGYPKAADTQAGFPASETTKIKELQALLPSGKLT